MSIRYQQSIAALTFAFISTALVGQQTGVPNRGDLAIVGATVFDATGAAPTLKTVLISNGRISKVGSNLAIPDSYKVINAEGEALLPGFFDLHTHWTPGGSPRSTPLIANADLASGVTTTNDFNASPESFEARRAWLATLVAPHVNLCGRLSTPGGHGADWGDTATTKWVSTPPAARAGVDAIVPYKPDCLGEVMTDGWRYGGAPDMTSMNEDTIAALVDEAHKSHIPVLTHTVTVTKGAEAGEAKVDVIAHALQDRDIDAATIASIKEGGSALAPTLAVYEPNKPGQRNNSPEAPPRTAKAMQKWMFAQQNTLKLYKAGVPIALGTDAGMPSTLHGKAALREMELLVNAGLSPSAALIAGTSNSARAMGELEDRGTIENGKRADLVLIKGMPWVNIVDVENIDRTFVDGALVFGPGAPAPNADLPMDAVKIGKVIDDFERPDGRSNLDTLVITNPDHGLDRSTEIMQLMPGKAGGHALMITAKMAVKEDPTASVVLPLTKGSIAPADVSEYHGIKLDIRGDGDYQLNVNSLHGTWLAAVTGGKEWKTMEVPFSSLQFSVGNGAKKTVGTWNGRDLTEIELTMHRSGGTMGWIEIDNVSFY